MRDAGRMRITFRWTSSSRATIVPAVIVFYNDSRARARQRERGENEKRAVSADGLRPQETRAEPRSTFLGFIMESRAPDKKRNIRATQSVSSVPLTGFYDRCFYDFSFLSPPFAFSFSLFLDSSQVTPFNR